MKAVLEFTLPEERYEHALACNAGDLLSALNEIRQAIRRALKYETHTDETRVKLEELRELIPFSLIDLIESGADS